ncbi:MAG: hypothetical protein K8I29_12585 [Alphaproteobacteria bacterium]|uniref:SprT-like domain-containing protein n=1 Tax=Candidatus Nitrobium versatile TaxID=2884831 RepID=A0A953J608_9BACT|nr:hypothetical protein [Candidatus Nitrobium versatile]
MPGSSQKRCQTQPDLFAARGEESLAAYFAGAVGRPVALTVTDNSTSMLSVRKREGELRVRLHRIFLDADTAVLEEMCGFIRGRRGKMPLFRDFIRRNRHAIRNSSPKRMKVDPRGRFHNLKCLFDEVNREYFEGRITSSITWGIRNGRHTVRRRTLGSYSCRTDTIRIHPVLDRKDIPFYFLKFIIYHEMLHAEMGIEERNGRRLAHTKEFRRRERLYREYDRAVAWERKGVP